MTGQALARACARGAVVALSGALIGAGAASATTPRASHRARVHHRMTDARRAHDRGTGTPINHVIEIMLENHTFDNLFGQFPGADGIPAGATLPNPAAVFDSEPDVSPVWATANEGDVQGGIDNSRPGLQMAMDYQPGQGYQMDNYTWYPNDGMSSITEFGPGFDPNLQYLARGYELADDNFQPAIAPSNPNIHFALNATVRSTRPPTAGCTTTSSRARATTPGTRSSSSSTRPG
ncbi:MAG TPA: alkaline phosphatase family protein [Solirubrobacteraceae bacterium]|jgi:phospholipase C|nr:alkaline phosphatase family protein [Solirubrobacteraceae bacterium]